MHVEMHVYARWGTCILHGYARTYVHFNVHFFFVNGGRGLDLP